MAHYLLTLSIRSHKAFASRTLGYSSKPMLAHGALLEVPELIAVHEAHFKANMAMKRSGRHLNKHASATLICVVQLVMEHTWKSSKRV